MPKITVEVTTEPNGDGDYEVRINQPPSSIFATLKFPTLKEALNQAAGNLSDIASRLPEPTAN